jgi:CspA family cold shock protein
VRGTVKRHLSAKGFGFIEDAQGVEYFFHQSACARGEFAELKEGDKVEFTVAESTKGPRAEEVRKA